MYVQLCVSLGLLARTNHGAANLEVWMNLLIGERKILDVIVDLMKVYCTVNCTVDFLIHSGKTLLRGLWPHLCTFCVGLSVDSQLAFSYW